MQLTADQELRKELLLFSLCQQPDVETAIVMAARMEHFVLAGLEGCGGKVALVPGGRKEVAEAAGNATAAEAAPIPGRFGEGTTKRRWSEADDAEFRELWHSAATLEEIAELLNRTTPSLYSRARALDLARRAPAGKAPSSPEGQPAEQESEAAEKLVAGTQVAGARRGEVMLERFGAARIGSGKRPNQPRSTTPNGALRGHAGLAAVQSGKLAGDEISVDPIIQFLRSRDYSVVSAGEGRFRLDGRRILSVNELREKANQVRKALGQPPFASLEAVPVN